MKTIAALALLLAASCSEHKGRICEPGAVQAVGVRIGDRVLDTREYRGCVRISKNFGGVYGWIPLNSTLSGSDVETANAEGKMPEGVSTW